MHVQTHTDRNIQASEAWTAQVEGAIAGALSRVVDRVTRVDVRLSDENGAKGGADDKRCMMEARLEGRPPTAVLRRAATIEQAIGGAVGKLARAVETVLARAQLLRGAARTAGKVGNDHSTRSDV